MDKKSQITSNYEQKFNSAIERVAQRMGGTFVHNERWSDLMRATEEAEKQIKIKL